MTDFLGNVYVRRGAEPSLALQQQMRSHLAVEYDFVWPEPTETVGVRVRGKAGRTASGDTPVLPLVLNIAVNKLELG